ncbi:PTH11-like integral membrane protein [Aspergillus stella-maris]|uniref:PTH11-like integral membrane protein n=1 Tax=Aspergillus stella-maris TaxID=1810926 RepID=UPI003CCD7DC4
MRLYTRTGLIKRCGREDWTMLASLVFAVVYAGLAISRYKLGLGKQPDDLTQGQLEKQLKCLWVAVPMYIASLGLTKVSLIFQYLRLFPNRRFCIICYVVLGVVVLWSIFAIISGLLNCLPVAKFWNRELPGTCLNFEIIWFFNASMSIATDLIIPPFPVFQLSKLRLPWAQKTALFVIFMLGWLVVITGILRLFSLHQAAEHPDTSWSNVGAAFWTAAECNIAIICACLPFLRPLVCRIVPILRSTVGSRSKTTTNSTRTIASRTARLRATASQDPEFGLLTLDANGKVVPIAEATATGTERAKRNGSSSINEAIPEVRTGSTHEGDIGVVGADTSQTNLVLNGR